MMREQTHDRGRLGVSWLIAAVLGLVCGALGVGSAEANDAELLGEERWEERSYGLSLLPPAHSRKLEQVTDGSLVTFLGEDGSKLSVYIRQAREEVDIQTVERRALEQFLYAFPSALELEQDEPIIEPAGRPGRRVYFAVPGDEEWIAGQAFMLIDPYTVALLQYETAAENYERAQRLFDAVIQSIELMDPSELDAMRSEQLEAGERWLEGVDAERIREQWDGAGWYRILEAGEDVGYQLMELHEEQEMGHSGLELKVQSRVVEGENAYDSANSYFLSNDGEMELWEARTTFRKVRGQGGLGMLNEEAGSRGWAEMGIRDRAGLSDRSKIDVVREMPTRVVGDREQGHGMMTTNVRELEWDQPDVAYAPQLVLQMFADLLPVPEGEVRELAVYGYFSNAARLAIRTVRIEPTEEGHAVYDRPTLDRGERVSRYDMQGRLIEREMPDGRVFKPASAEEIAEIWEGRE